jgi:hypothetical protein
VIKQARTGTSFWVTWRLLKEPRDLVTTERIEGEEFSKVVEFLSIHIYQQISAGRLEET